MNTIELTEFQKQYINPNAKLWIETLKFGGLPQTYENLQDEDGYCCLGVGCKVYEDLNGKCLVRQNQGFYFGSTLNEQTPVVYFLGLFDNHGSTKVPYTPTLWDLNDNRGWDFPKIADFMLVNCDRVFVPVAEQKEYLAKIKVDIDLIV